MLWSVLAMSIQADPGCLLWLYTLLCAAAEWASLDMSFTEMHPGRQDLHETLEVGLAYTLCGKP